MSEATGAETETLATARLRLVRFTREKISARYLAWLNDPDVLRYSELRHRRNRREDAEAYVAAIDQRTSHLWAIILKGGDHIGNISAHRDLPNGTAEVGILLGDATVHGRGYGTEAWRAVCDWLFETGIRKISAGAMTENQPMRRIFEKCGMSEDGIRRGHLLLDGRPRDVVHVALFRKP